eukprot:949159-Alexandrium_andersonii.AAC.1
MAALLFGINLRGWGAAAQMVEPSLTIARELACEVAAVAADRIVNDEVVVIEERPRHFRGISESEIRQI